MGDLNQLEEMSLYELEQFEVCQVKVEKATGHVCPRCWNYTESENEDGLCDRCNHVLHD